MAPKRKPALAKNSKKVDQSATEVDDLNSISNPAEPRGLEKSIDVKEPNLSDEYSSSENEDEKIVHQRPQMAHASSFSTTKVMTTSSSDYESEEEGDKEEESSEQSTPEVSPLKVKKMASKSPTKKINLLVANGEIVAKSSKVKYSVMIKTSLKELHSRSGTSLKAIEKYILQNFAVESTRFNSNLKIAMKKCLADGSVVSTSGKIALIGSFKLSPELKKKSELKALQDAKKSAKAKKIAETKKSTKKETASKKSKKDTPAMVPKKTAKAAPEKKKTPKSASDKKNTAKTVSEKKVTANTVSDKKKASTSQSKKAQYKIVQRT